MSPLLQRMLCAKLSWYWPRGSGEEDFKNLSMYFCYFVIISPWKRTWPLIWILNSHKNVLYLVWLKLDQWFLSRRFLYFVNIFSLFLNYLPLEKSVALHLNRYMIVLVHENHEKMDECYTSSTFLQWFWPCKSCKFFPWFQYLSKIWLNKI